MNIGRSIRVACAQKDMTQLDLATNTGVSEVTISKLVNDRVKCKQQTLEAMAKAFDMQVSYFIALGE